MERNANAALSPHEELVLRRLANGSVGLLPMVPDRHVHRLLQFELVSKQGGQLVLTTVGKARVSAMVYRHN